MAYLASSIMPRLLLKTASAIAVHFVIEILARIIVFQ
jgi:hypothetical protein